MAQVTLNVPEISCEHCVRTVTAALQPLEGVRRVRVDIPTQQVRVEYDKGAVGVARVMEVLQEEEYPVASVEPVTAGSARGAIEQWRSGSSVGAGTSSVRRRPLPPSGHTRQ